MFLVKNLLHEIVKQTGINNELWIFTIYSLSSSLDESDDSTSFLTSLFGCCKNFESVDINLYRWYQFRVARFPTLFWKNGVLKWGMDINASSLKLHDRINADHRENIKMRCYEIVWCIAQISLLIASLLFQTEMRNTNLVFITIFLIFQWYLLTVTRTGITKIVISRTPTSRSFIIWFTIFVEQPLTYLKFTLKFLRIKFSNFPFTSSDPFNFKLKDPLK